MINDKINKVLLLLNILLLSACSVGGLTSGYKQLSENDKKAVLNYNGDIRLLKEDRNVYNIQVKQVKDFIAQHNEVVVYDFTPYCVGSNCINPHDFINGCKAKGKTPVIISNSYDEIFKFQKLGIPMLMIDTGAFSTKCRSKYTKQFYDELTGIPVKERGWGGYVYFKDGKFVKAYDNFEDVP